LSKQEHDKLLTEAEVHNKENCKSITTSDKVIGRDIEKNTRIEEKDVKDNEVNVKNEKEKRKGKKIGLGKGKKERVEKMKRKMELRRIKSHSTKIFHIPRLLQKKDNERQFLRFMDIIKRL